MEHADSEIEKN